MALALTNAGSGRMTEALALALGVLATGQAMPLAATHTITVTATHSTAMAATVTTATAAATSATSASATAATAATTASTVTCIGRVDQGVGLRRQHRCSQQQGTGRQGQHSW